MRHRAEHFEITLIVAGLGLTWLFKTIFEGLFYSALLKQLETRFGLVEAEVIAKFSTISVPLVASIITIWAIYRFVLKNVRREFALDLKPRLALSYAAEKTLSRGGGAKQTFLYAKNESRSDVSSVQVKIEESQFRKEGSSNWQGTSIVSRTNMSWGFLPDGDPQKYSTVQLPPGSEPIDFVSGPINVQLSNGQTHLGFVIRVDPKHRGVNPFFLGKRNVKIRYANIGP